jgi:serine/threonine protein kinase
VTVNPAPTPPAAGEVVADRYEVGEVLGRGGMAEVRAGVDRRLGRPVAIKFLLPEMAARADIRTRFEAEARAAASLSHPNAVAVFDTGEHAGAPYIVMERLPGETLADRIATGPAQDTDTVLTLAIEVLGALGAAHAAGLVHRDVKPANILIAADGRAKVADFGIAKSIQDTPSGDLTVTGQLLGTPAYLAPERLDGAPASPRADIWSLGVVLYELLAGTRPFVADTPLGTARAAAGGTHRPLAEIRPDVDPAVVAAVERAMDPDPSARFASAAEMGAALGGREAVAAAPGVNAAAATVPLGARGDTEVLPEPAAMPHGPWSSPARRILLWVGVGALAVGVILLLASVGRDDRPSSSSAPPPTDSAPPTTAAATTAPSARTALAGELRAAAAGLGSDDGALAPNLATRLVQLAASVEAGGGGGEATGLLATTVGWARAGQLSGDTASTVIDLLVRVPGVNTAVVDALAPASETPSPHAGEGDNEGEGNGGRGGKGKGGKGDD